MPVLQVKALIANEPYLSGDGGVKKASSQRGLKSVVRLLLAAVFDKVGAGAGVKTWLS